MAKHRSGRRRSRRSYRSKARRANPFKTHSYRRRRNPRGIGGGLSTAKSWIIWGTAGAVLTRVIPQSVLPSYNSGIAGVALNLGTAMLGSGLVGSMFGRDAGTKFMVGGVVAVGQRIFSEFISSKASFGLSGDLDFDLGFYLPNQFPLPTTGVGPYLLQPGVTGAPMAAGGMPGISPIAQITPAPSALTPTAPGSPSVVPDEPGRWSSRWAS